VIVALLYSISVQFLSKTRCKITLTPNRLGRIFRRRVRSGVAFKGRDDEDDTMCWWWQATGRYVGSYIERYIEASPLMTIEEMPIEMLLGDGGKDTEPIDVSATKRRRS
jgi:hypothetical protein